jgi:hypothetical protein
VHKNITPRTNQKATNGLHRDTETLRYGDTETQRLGDTDDVTARGQEAFTWRSLSEQSIAINEEHPWQSRTWLFTRYLKSLSGSENLSAAEAHRKIPWEETEFDEEDQASPNGQK